MSYKETEIYKAHEKIGFPKLDNETQFRILVEHDNNPILDLVPHLRKEGFPFGLLNEYITITKEEFKKHLIKINYIQTQLDSYSSTYDGFWLRKVPNGYEFFERERGRKCML